VLKPFDDAPLADGFGSIEASLATLRGWVLSERLDATTADGSGRMRLRPDPDRVGAA
jgi:hypothetical protein